MSKRIVQRGAPVAPCGIMGIMAPTLTMIFPLVGRAATVSGLNASSLYLRPCTTRAGAGPPVGPSIWTGSGGRDGSTAREKSHHGSHTPDSWT